MIRAKIFFFEGLAGHRVVQQTLAGHSLIFFCCAIYSFFRQMQVKTDSREKNLYNEAQVS